MRGQRLGPAGGTLAVPGGLTHAVRVLRQQRVERPVVLAYSPAYANNPFQELLVAACWEQGIAPVALPHLEDVGLLSIARELGVEVVLHLHWTNQLQEPDRDATRAAHDKLRADVEEVGAKVVWTVHNRLPHECPHPDLEVELRRWLVERADLVHVMGETTPAAVADLYRLDPARTVVVPHPSYQGVYPATISREQARWELGLAPDEGILLQFGGIRPYKNVPLALEALDVLLERGRRVRMVVAGMLLGDWDGREDLEQELMLHPAVSAHLGRVAEADVQRFFLAADAALLPYTTIVNSGVLLLGATWRTPAVATSAGEVGALVRRAGLGVTFDPASGASAMADAVEEVLDGDHAAMTDAARRLDDQLRPVAVAQQYVADVVHRVLRG